MLFGFPTRPNFTASIRARKVATATKACRELAEAYALTGKADYARGARKLLLRFAEVYPNWLVHVGYGEYADMDPHVAALNIKNLPEKRSRRRPAGRTSPFTADTGRAGGRPEPAWRRGSCARCSRRIALYA